MTDNMGGDESQVVGAENTVPQSTHGMSSNVSTHSSARPGIFDRTFNPYHQRTRKKLANALVLSIDNSKNPPGKSHSR